MKDYSHLDESTQLLLKKSDYVRETFNKAVEKFGNTNEVLKFLRYSVGGLAISREIFIDEHGRGERKNDWEREYDAHDPINGVDLGPCPEFAPDTLGDTPDVCIRCFYNRVDHK